ncbi:MAG: GDSL-type esterase/lipase family protein [Rhodobacteraceae bacterium]|nr:GDSL-type esterase/lipase family protein [Paracoccaceae bacterium]
MTRTVLCFGDSNTHGTPPMPHLDFIGRWGREERWPGVMAAALGPAWHVVEEGHPGRTTVHPDPIEGAHRNGLAVLPALLESHWPIDLVIVKLGTNDLKPRFAVNAGDIALAVGRLADAILASGAGPGGAAPAILLVAPPPILEAGCLAEMFAGGRAKSLRLAGAIRAEAERRGLPFLDAGSVIAVDPLDGIHYGRAAHAALGAALAAEVRRLWP